jgi:hypothetical protein
MDRPSTSAAIRAVAFDTDVLIGWFRGSERARRFRARGPRRRRAVPSVVVMELLQGCRSRAEAGPVRDFLAENFAVVLYPNEVIARRAEDLIVEHAASHGLRVGDAIIAATAIENDAILATGNARHYRAVRGLRLRRFDAGRES